MAYWLSFEGFGDLGFRDPYSLGFRVYPSAL